ncbi:MAG: hypothetical protein UX77_C0029G0003 [Parcubacteria group bacterium GW2011_GWA1_47_11]|nr:MAG: hypothetical protein UX77_C0029G0003 [Parcubacteria group bacterium GW2011_GWA1_47_11]
MMYMRTIIFTLTSLLVFAAVPAYAATISLAPTTVSVTKGQTFTVAVNVDGAGTKIYTVKTSVSYPAALLEATGFVIDPSWPLTPPGNVIDNVNGKLVEMAGFVGGFTNVKKFGTATFRAKESGSATIQVNSDSAAYDSQSKNTLAGTQGSAVVTIAAKAAIPTPTPAPAPAPKPKTTAKPAVTGSVVATTASTTAATTTVSTSTDIAATAGAGIGFSPWLLGGLVAIIVAGIGSWFIYRRQTGL